MNYDQAQPFVAVIDNMGIVYQTDSGRKRTAIGVDLQRESELLGQIGEMQDVIDNYYQALVKAGIIIPEKTPEEIAQAAAAEQLALAKEQAEQQAQINAALLDAVKSLQSEIKEMAMVHKPINPPNFPAGL